MTTPNITVNIFNYGDAPDVSRIASQVAAAVAPAPEPDPVPRIVPVFPWPLDNDTRRQLFAAFRDVFGSTDRDDRLQFTRSALGLANDAPASWREDGGITQDQAFHLLRVLNTIRSILA